MVHGLSRSSAFGVFPGTDPEPPALAGRVLATGPPAMLLWSVLNESSSRRILGETH